MLPKANLTTQIKEKLLKISNIGDLLEEAGKLSIEEFKKAQEKNPLYKIDGIENEVLILAIATQSYKGIPRDKEQKFLALASDRQQFKRGIVNEILSNEGNSLNLEPQDKIVILGYLRLAPLFDEFFIQWRERVKYSKTGEQFEEDPESATKFREDNGLLTSEYLYSVILEEDGKYKEQSLIDAFPVVIKRIIEEMTKLSTELVEGDGDVEYIDYINAYIDLLSNTEVDKYEFFSKDLDGLWLKLNGNLLPIHMCEVYEDPGKYIVQPDFSLHFVDNRFDDVNDQIENTKSALIEYLKNRYPGYKSLEASVPMMLRAVAKVYVAVVEGGATLAMRPFGENLPNWEEIRKDEGVRILLDMETSEIRWVPKRMNLIKIFGETAVKKQIDPYYEDEKKILKYEAIVNVGGHEIAHNAFIADDTTERLTPPLKARIEEIKATFAIISSIDESYTDEEKKLIVLADISHGFMILAFADDSSKVAYVYDTIATMKSAFEAGIITHDNDTYLLDLNTDKIMSYLQSVKKKFDMIAHIYDKGHSQDVQDFIDEQFSRTDEIQEIIDKLAV